jgi:hypothetical protein
MDLIIARYVFETYGHISFYMTIYIRCRKGNILQTLHLALLYLIGRELKSDFMSYIKIKAAIIEQNEVESGLNIDGEVLSGPGPWRMEVVPSLFKVLSEK